MTTAMMTWKLTLTVCGAKSCEGESATRAAPNSLREGKHSRPRTTPPSSVLLTDDPTSPALSHLSVSDKPERKTAERKSSCARRSARRLCARPLLTKPAAEAHCIRLRGTMRRGAQRIHDVSMTVFASEPWTRTSFRLILHHPALLWFIYQPRLARLLIARSA